MPLGQPAGLRGTVPAGFTHWGSFAEYVAIDHAEQNLVHLPESMSYATAASLGCRFATSFRAVVDQGRLKGGEWLAVHGCGGVGLSAIMIARDLAPGSLRSTSPRTNWHWRGNSAPK